MKKPLLTSVLLTGATGICGREITEYFESVSDRYVLTTTSRSALNRKGHLIHDLSNRIELNANEFPLNMDIIIHSAGVVDEKSHDFAVVDANLRCAYNIANYARASNAKILINLSSIAVYGSPFEKVAYDEESICLPSSDYGLAKLLSENLFKACLPAKTRYINLRLGYVVSRFMHAKYLLTRLYKGLINNEKIKLINADKSFLPLFDARDLAMICERVAVSNFEGDLNCVGSQAPSVRETFKVLRSCVKSTHSEIDEEKSDDLPIAAKYRNDLLLNVLPTLNLQKWQDTIVWALMGNI